MPSYQWLCRMEHQLNWSTGSGLGQFRYDKPVHERGDPSEWRRLAISPDREAIGVCGINCLKNHLRCNVWACWDWSHDAHNDFELGLDVAKLNFFVKTFVLVANIPCADWNTGHKWQQVKSVMTNYFEEKDPHSLPLFMSMVPRIMDSLADSGEVVASSDAVMDIWHRVQEACPWKKKDAKLKTSRFLGPLQRVKKELAHAPLYELAYTATCLQLDMLHGAGFMKVHIKGLSSKVETASSSTSTAATAAGEERALRSSCGNALTLGCMFWSDSTNVRKLAIITSVGENLLRWHQKQITELREHGALPRFLFCQVGGVFMQTLGHILRTLACEDVPPTARVSQVVHGSSVAAVAS